MQMRRMRKYEDLVQLTTGLAGAGLMGWWLHARGWQWFEWLPAAILAFFGVAVLWVAAWFIRRKTTYEQAAARNRADLRAGGDGWPRHRL